MALVSNVGNGNFMIDYVVSIALENVEDYKKVLRKLATLRKVRIFQIHQPRDHAVLQSTA